MIDIRFTSENNKCLLENEARSMVGAFYPGQELVLSSGDLPSGAFFRLNSGDHTAEGRCGEPLRHNFKLELYRLLSDMSGRQLPWGSLTGVRPVKLLTKHLSEGATPEESLRWFTEVFRVSGEKAGMALDIALRQRELMDRETIRGGYSLYVGIPFCPTTCLYCSFASVPMAGAGSLVAPYLEALKREIRESALIMGGRLPSSVYIGGGTPSSLTPEDTDVLLTALEESFHTDRCGEVTFEAGRPDTITEDILSVLKSHGISRISVNPQTMNEKTLRLIGRGHTPEQTRQAFALARDMGFDDINMDLILGLPGEGMDELKITLREVEDMSPDSLTIHALAIKRGSRLNEYIIENIMERRDDTCTEAMQEECTLCTQRLGMKPYYLYRQKNIAGNFENAGYARPGKYCLYNMVTMEENQSVLALGAGAVSKRVYDDDAGNGCIRRCDNAKEVRDYISRIDELIARKAGLFA